MDVHKLPFWVCATQLHHLFTQRSLYLGPILRINQKEKHHICRMCASLLGNPCVGSLLKGNPFIWVTFCRKNVNVGHRPWVTFYFKIPRCSSIILSEYHPHWIKRYPVYKDTGVQTTGTMKRWLLYLVSLFKF